jgi:hypothetical protein
LKAKPCYGYRRVTVQLRRDCVNADHKRVLRIMGEIGVMVIL